MSRSAWTRPRISRRDLLLVGGLGALAAVAGCGSSGASQGASGLTFTDQRRASVRLAGPARRVVTIPIPAAAVLIGIDEGAEHLAGMNAASASAIKQGLLGTIYPAAKQVPSGVAGENFAPNVEAIVGLNADLVVQWADKGSGIIAPLESAGLPVVGLDYGTQADLEDWIAIFGEFLGKQARASELLSRMNEHRRQVQAATARVQGAGPKLLYFLRSKDGLQVAGRGTYNDFCASLVGAVNPAASLPGFVDVGPEQVLRWDPDIIVLGNFDASAPSDLYRDPVWKDVAAVRAKRVYKAPLGGYRWDPPNLESPLMWRWLQLLTHPGAVDFDLRAAVVEEYRVLYHYTPSGAQLDAILHTEVNDASADYGQFHG